MGRKEYNLIAFVTVSEIPLSPIFLQKMISYLLKFCLIYFLDFSFLNMKYNCLDCQI